NSRLLGLAWAQIISHQPEWNRRDPNPCKNECQVKKQLNAHWTLTCVGSTEKCCEKQKSSNRGDYCPRHLSQGRKRTNKYKTRSHESGETRATKDEMHCAVKGQARG